MDEIQLDRFMAKVEKRDDGCWIWIGATGGTPQHRYGVFNAAGKYTTAHRLAYEHFVGPLIEDRKWSVDHLCGVKLCVNPDHLEQITQRENLLRSPATVNAIGAAKTECVHGHEFTPENTYRNPTTGLRSCRACKREWMRRKRANS